MAGTSTSHGQTSMSAATGHEPASPGQSSPEAFEEDEESSSATPANSQQWQGGRPASPSSSQPQRAPAPLQKRRRVTRACDECRRKKIKCDGKQPCTHCTVYSYDCTYDQPSNRRRNPAPQYIEALEIRLQRAEAALNVLSPGIDLNDPNLDATIRQRRQAGNARGAAAVAPGAAVKPGAGSDSDQEGQLRSMIESTGQLDLDEDGRWDFHGGSSGTVFINRMRQQFGGLLGDDKSTPFLPRLPKPYPGTTTVFDSPKSTTDSPFESGLPNTIDLPSKEVAKALVADSLGLACSLLRFVHEPSFYQMFDRIYDVPADNFGDEENRFLPLLYVVLALGCMFHPNPSDNVNVPQENTYRAGIDQGLKYFRAARQMMDITDCRDLTSLQAILFMIMFLQSTANLSTCYSYIGIALRSSLRMGLHRNLTFNFNPIERETRRRVFWIVRKMDTYVSALLGFPNMLSSDDIDQELPLEIDDEYITADAIYPMPPGKLSAYAASNAHTRLVVILAKVIKHIYPVKGLDRSAQTSSSSCYVISHTKIKEMERELAEWSDKLPMALRPDGDGSPEIVRVQQLLRLAYGHVQMMLYRPFLHYLSPKSLEGKTIDKRSYACAAACVSVSRNIVHITSEMKKRGLLVGAYWFTMYTTFFAILSLVYFVLENPNDPAAESYLADANAGKDALKGLAQRSQAADRCSIALTGLFERLSERLKPESVGTSSQRKKRPVPSERPISSQLSTSAPRSQSSLKEPTVGISRATTFPMQTSAPLATSHPARSSLDGHTVQSHAFSNPNLRQHYRDYTPTDMSAVGTPDSGSSGSHGMQQQQYPTYQHFGMSNTLPDLGAMMFPSADPFAYPNQPMMEFDNVKRENIDMTNSGSSQGSQMYVQDTTTGGGQALFDELEGQIFGPLPPYLDQGQQQQQQANFDIQQQQQRQQQQQQQQQQMGRNPNDMMGAMNPQAGFYAGIIPSNDMNFEAIFTGEGNEWGNPLADPRFLQYGREG